MGDVDWTALGDALLRVERLTAEDSGLLSFGLAKTGGIFVEKGRVCWVAARGLQRRLRDLLLRYSSIDEATLDRACERCRNSGGLLGETLVAEGLLRASELERALRQHSAECLVELCREPLPTRWALHGGRGYAPSFTFRAVDLLLDAVGSHFPELKAQAQQELGSLAARSRSAVAFVLDPERECLLPIATLGAQSVEELRALGSWAISMPLASLELAAAPSFTLAATEEGEAVLVWWRDGLLFAVLCEDRASLATAVTARYRACA